jgi:DNA-binding NarL/FixJ family response regulator/signal transduction histidine kinase
MSAARMTAARITAVADARDATGRPGGEPGRGSADHLDGRARPSRDSVRPAVPIDALSGAVEDLAGEFALRPLLGRILSRAVALLGAQAGSISTVDERAGVYRKEADLGAGCREGREFPLAEGVTGAVVARRGPVVFDSYAEVPGGQGDGDQGDVDDRDRLYATVGVPICWRGRIIGVCVVFSTDPRVRFGESDVELLSLFAGHAAIALTNATLHARAARRDRRTAVHGERERMVREVHDTVARALGSILVHLDALDSAAPQARLDAARAAARSALAETRRSVLGLGPVLLASRTLAQAVADEVAWVRSVTPLRVDLVVTGEQSGTTPGAALCAFEVLREALTNVVAHACASVVRVGVMHGADEVTVVVEDDGRGFDPADARARRAGLGLSGMVARTHQAGAHLAIESTPGWGTRIRARIPHTPPTEGRPSRQAAPWRVLVAAHRPVLRAGLTALLARAEPEITVAGEVDDAREVAASVSVLEPDLVLVDLRMPGLDGARLTSYIRAARPDTAVLVITDDPGDELLRQAVHAGARGCVGTDLDGPALVRAVLAAIRGDVLLTERVLRRFAEDRPAPEGLTGRESEVRSLVERGLPDKKIASTLGISVKTVEKHVGAVLRKTGAANRTALAHRAASR